MWIVKLVTFVEYHPLLTLCALASLLGLIWFFRREVNRPSFRQQDDLKHLLADLEPTPFEDDIEKEP